MGKIRNINNKRIPSEISGNITITAVFVEGEIGDYAVYIGQGSPAYIAEYGDKLSFNEAREHFPGIEKEKYRR